MGKAICRIGEKLRMNNGHSATVIAYKNNRDMDVRFDDGYVVRGVRYGNFARGQVSFPQFYEIVGDYARVTNPNTSPTLNFLCDVEDVERVMQCSWAMRVDGYIANRKFGKLHRLVMDAPRDREVDHINHDKTDCRKRNLRLCLHGENMCNRSLYTNNKTGYKGVSWHIRDNVYTATIGKGGKIYHLGYFSTAEEAAHAYNRAAFSLHGEYANLNTI